MNLILIYILLTLFCSVLSQDTGSCSLNITDIKNNKIDIDSYCTSDKPCIVKCCGENEVIHKYKNKEQCKHIDVLKKELSNYTIPDKIFDYSNLVKIYNNDIYKSVQLSTKKFNEFKLLHSKAYEDRRCTKSLAADRKLVEKGTIMLYRTNHYDNWISIKTPKFCVDLKVGISKKTQKPLSLFVQYFIKVDEKSSNDKDTYIAISMLVSAFFLLLFLAVYAVLPQLRNIQGMVLMAYVATLMCTYTLKASSIIYSQVEKKHHRSPDCTLITKIIYFFILASFFWLKLMSFDIWWTFRGTRKLREIHRRGINVKFAIYASYAYYVPAALVIFYSIMDAQDLPAHIAKPFFDKCFVTDTTFLYLYVPLMILTGFNCLLFVMTLYNIWQIKRNMSSFDKTAVTKTKKNQNMFLLYLKLWSLMGVSWILELIQLRMDDDDVPVWLYALLNAYNMFIGVVIFFMFIFKRSIFLMLCKRFKISNKWTRQQYKINSSTRSELSKGSKSYSRNYSRTKSTDSDVEEGSVIKKEEERRLKPEFTLAIAE